MKISIEFKVFLTFFLIFLFFIRWPGMPGNSVLSLTRSIVDNNVFSIDKYANQTSDRTLYESHYYSDKEPGLSFISVPSYILSKIITINYPFEDSKTEYVTVLTINGVEITQIKNANFSFLISLIFITLFSSVLFNSLTPVLVYKIGNFFFEKKYSLLTSFIYGLGSLAFHYSISFLSYGVSTFFIFFSFFIILKLKFGKSFTHKKVIISGILAGTAVTIELLAAPIALLLLIYLSFSKKKFSLQFVVGLLIGLIPLLLYNFSIFNNPFELARTHLDPIIWPQLQSNPGISFNFNNLFVAYRLLIDPYRGFFFYFPIYFLSFFGLVIMWKFHHKLESILFFAIFLTILLLSSAWWAWWHGGFFGPRLLLFSIPFLTIPLGFAIKKTNKYIFLFLFLISIFSNIIGLQLFYEDAFKDFSNSSMMKQEFSSQIYSFQPFPNVLGDYYLPLFLQNGPRSRIFENLLLGKIPDIRDFVYLKNPLPFVNLIIFPIVLILLWGKLNSFKHRE